MSTTKDVALLGAALFSILILVTAPLVSSAPSAMAQSMVPRGGIIPSKEVVGFLTEFGKDRIPYRLGTGWDILGVWDLWKKHKALLDEAQECLKKPRRNPPPSRDELQDMQEELTALRKVIILNMLGRYAFEVQSLLSSVKAGKGAWGEITKDGEVIADVTLGGQKLANKVSEQLKSLGADDILGAGLDVYVGSEYDQLLKNYEFAVREILKKCDYCPGDAPRRGGAGSSSGGGQFPSPPLPGQPAGPPPPGPGEPLPSGADPEAAPSITHVSSGDSAEAAADSSSLVCEPPPSPGFTFTEGKFKASISDTGGGGDFVAGESEGSFRPSSSFVKVSDSMFEATGKGEGKITLQALKILPNGDKCTYERLRANFELSGTLEYRVPNNPEQGKGDLQVKLKPVGGIAVPIPFKDGPPKDCGNNYHLYYNPYLMCYEGVQIDIATGTFSDARNINKGGGAQSSESCGATLGGASVLGENPAGFAGQPTGPTTQVPRIPVSVPEPKLSPLPDAVQPSSPTGST